MAVVVKPLWLLIILSLLGMAERLPVAHSARLLQSARDTFYAGSDASEKEKPEDDAIYFQCRPLASKPAHTSPAPMDDNKKEKEKPEDYAMSLPCWPLAPAPAPTSPAPINYNKKEKEKPADDAIYFQCRPRAPAPAPTSPAPIKDDKKEKEKPEDDAVYLKCWLAPTSAPTSAAHVNDNKEGNPKLLVICGYPCCGFNIHGPCNRCCPKGGLHLAPPTTHVEEAGNGGGDGHGGGNGHD